MKFFIVTDDDVDVPANATMIEYDPVEPLFNLVPGRKSGFFCPGIEKNNPNQTSVSAHIFKNQVNHATILFEGNFICEVFH